jgi:hypothetical protein
MTQMNIDFFKSIQKDRIGFSSTFLVIECIVSTYLSICVDLCPSVDRLF